MLLQTLPSTHTASGARILVVEDEGLIARDIGARLQKAGFEVAGTLDTGEAALQQISSIAPDLVLMDIRLRGAMDGIETARRLREQVDVPVIYLTAHSDRDTLDRAKVTGPFAYLTKPISQSALPISIEMALYRHRSERESRQQRAWLATVLGSMADAVIVTDSAGRVQFLNPAAEAITGWRSVEVPGKPLSAVLRLLDSQADKIVRDLIPLTGSRAEPVRLPEGMVLVTRSGFSVPVEGEVAFSRSEGRIAGTVITFRDISGRQAQEQQLLQRQKMQAVGRIASGVAHDFNNLLTVILGHTDHLRTGEPLSASARDSVEEIEKAAVTAASVTRQLLTFSRLRNHHRQTLDLNEIIREHELLCQRLLGSSIEWHTRLEPGLRPIQADPGQLSQVLINLVTNAREAMPKGGVIEIETANVFLGGTQPVGTAGEHYVVLTVRDNGIGMAPEVADGLFEPFFTAKSSQKGTGLGLSIVHGIVSDLGGTIAVDSKPGEGATFTVYLPESTIP